MEHTFPKFLKSLDSWLLFYISTQTGQSSSDSVMLRKGFPGIYMDYNKLL